MDVGGYPYSYPVLAESLQELYQKICVSFENAAWAKQPFQFISNSTGSAVTDLTVMARTCIAGLRIITSVVLVYAWCIEEREGEMEGGEGERQREEGREEKREKRKGKGRMD